ncbi:MAG: hypothetical protein QOK40_33 [Miltoncostaeaceae bacterium]|jgi:hypothetical protein|nr:hypothetical protein [Miltoncostaeaceae bacterium]
MCLFDVYKGGPRADRRRAPAPTDGPGGTGDQAPPTAPTNGTTWPTDRERLWLRAIARFMRAAAEDLGPDSPVGRRLADGAREAAMFIVDERPPLSLVPDPPEAAASREPVR